VISDEYRYRYSNKTDEWIMSGIGCEKKDLQTTCHPDSPNSGKFWMSKAVSFLVKMSSNPQSKKAHVRLLL